MRKFFFGITSAIAIAIMGYGIHCHIREMVDTAVTKYDQSVTKWDSASRARKYEAYNKTRLVSGRIVVNDASLGSGTLVAPTKMLTAHHVLYGEDGMGRPEKIEVTIGGKKYLGKAGKVDRKKDLALIEFDVPITGVPTSAWTCSDRDPSPEEYHTVGNPYGQNQVIRHGHLAANYWSGWDSNPFDPILEKDQFEEFQNLFAHRVTYDMMSQPGNSGGGIFDEAGVLVGLVSAGNIVPSVESKLYIKNDEGKWIIPEDVHLQIIVIGTYTYAIKASSICSFLRGVS